MQFIVRYWSPHLNEDGRDVEGNPLLVDYSSHPPTRLGLHNALLSLHDRSEILEAHGGNYVCDVFVVEGRDTQLLTPEMAVSLFKTLPDGDIKWIDIKEFLLPQNRRSPVPVMTEGSSHQQQLQLFEYGDEPYYDPNPLHHLNIDA